MGALRGHLSFFTMLRMDIDENDMREMNARFHLVPIVGLLYGLISGFGILILQELVGMAAAVAATLLAIQLFNRFLHMDGLMDVGDGLVVSGGREDHLRALKDSRIGAGGVAFALFVTLLAFSGLASLPRMWIPLIPLAVEVMARNAMVATAAFGKAGDGMAGESVRLTGRASLVKSTALSVSLVAVVGGGIWIATSTLGWPTPALEGVLLPLVAVTAASILIGWVLARTAHRNFGIVNGDMLGASNEMSRALLVLLLLAVM